MRLWAADNRSPGVFALVMATGIVSIATADQRYHVIALILGVFAAAAFVLLTVIVSARVMRAPAAFVRRLHDPDVALRSFTFVAACGVLAAELGPVLGPRLGPPARTRSESARVVARRHRAHGSWLLISVATQSLAIATLTGDRILAARPATIGLHWLSTVARPQTLGSVDYR